MAADYVPALSERRAPALVIELCPGTVPLRRRLPFPPKRSDGCRVWDPELAREALYARLPSARAHALTRGLRPLAPHLPMLERPGALADPLDRIASERLGAAPVASRGREGAGA